MTAQAAEMNVLNAKPRRSRLDICFELLEVIWSKEEIKPTQLMYKANLSWKMLSQIVSYLSDRELVKYSEVGSRHMISLTEKGKACLQMLHDARSVLMPADQVGPDSNEFGESEKVMPSAMVFATRHGEQRAW
jgi:predicted transcriptional regulator